MGSLDKNFGMDSLPRGETLLAPARETSNPHLKTFNRTRFAPAYFKPESTLCTWRQQGEAKRAFALTPSKLVLKTKKPWITFRQRLNYDYI